MYTATILRHCAGDVHLGPTDSRDEAARLARVWIEANPIVGRPGEAHPAGQVMGVSISRDTEEED